MSWIDIYINKIDVSSAQVNVSSAQVNVSSAQVNVSSAQVNVSNDQVNVSNDQVDVSNAQVNVSNDQVNVSTYFYLFVSLSPCVFYEVENKMVINDNALRRYDKGISQHKTGNYLLITRSSLIVTGVIPGLTLPANTAINEDGTVNEWHIIKMLVGFSVGGTGLVTTISGLILRSKEKNNIGESVYTYNQRNNTSQVKFGFEASLNRVKLVVNF